MPIYTYHCSACERVQERVVSYAQRDSNQLCDECNVPMDRSGVELFTMGAPAYQMKAILGSGEKVAGHFGNSAALRKKQ